MVDSWEVSQLNCAPDVSLVVATFNRSRELESLLESLLLQTFKNFEVIIIDQSEDDLTKTVVEVYKGQLRLLYHHNPERGLSKARNIGISLSQGRILAFPDDDCVYYPDTIEKAIEAFNRNPRAAIILGRICDCRGNNLIRPWPRKEVRLTQYNFYWLYSSVTIFSSLRSLFDESLGLGTKFGSNEDADYIYRHLRSYLCLYTPSVRIFHSPLSTKEMPETKAFLYGLGFGAFCCKNWDLPIALLYCTSLLYHSLNLLKAGVRLNVEEARKFKAALWGRLLGLFQYASTKK
ncbi:MAG: glycosyltransferase family 2 protein [Desulforudis sp.]|jgi:glycosyltransferase involved in cell wall biosynthesis|nr:MAG: glycosyltransferase family 2 protein [Desulforudis sp.]